MFLVFSREKINTYLVSILTVVFLFILASMMTNSKTIETVNQNNKLVPIYNVETDENKIAFTMNCAW